MNIVVLAGGLSTERDVSLKSGEMIANALRQNGHSVILMDVFMGYGDKEIDMSDCFSKSEELSVKPSIISEVDPDLEAVKASRPGDSDNFFGPNVLAMCKLADIVFMGLHGENGENGKVQAVLDLFGIKYTGSGYLPSALAMDKGITKMLFEANEIPTPQGFAFEKGGDSRIPEDYFPVVVKPACGGSSIGVSIVDNEDAYAKAVETAFKYEDKIIVERYIKGREFSVGVIQGKALPVIEIAPVVGFYDYKNKYKAGSAVETCPADIPETTTMIMQSYAEKVCDVLGLNTYARMDFLLDEDNNMYCLEANTLPGMTPTSLLPQEAAVVGMSFNELCEKIIEISL